MSDSPYLRVFDRLEQVHHQIEEHALEKAMLEIIYHTINVLERTLPNGKKFVQMDFEHSQRDCARSYRMGYETARKCKEI